MAGVLGDEPAEPLGNRDTAAVDTDQRDPFQVFGLLDQLVGNPREGALERLGIEDGLPGCAACGTQGRYPVAGLIPAGRVISSPFRPLWTGLKGYLGKISAWRR